MADNTYDVVMVGGGLMGCATAYYLRKADEGIRVALVEMDPTYEKSSTSLSDGNARIQFNVEENIQISIYGMEVMERFAEEMAVDGERPDAAFRREGNLFLVDDAGRAEAEQGFALQRSLGCPVEWLAPDEIRQCHPLCEPVGCVGGTFSPQDGTMDPWAVLMAYKRKAVALGARFIEAEVVEILASESRVTGVRLASGEELMAGVVVNSAGAWAPRLARTVGIELPVQPVKRQVFVLETTVRRDDILPALFMPSGLYLFHERAGSFTCGKSLPDDAVGFKFDWDRRIFINVLWPELIEFVPAFDRVKVARGWAGLYAVNTFDGNGIFGPWPGLEGLFLITGFSGHGFQQCHAVGRHIAELILGQPPTLDLSVFAPLRILENKPVFESEGRLI
jgi:FAD-dependent oxidoreductase domain-containing protein 1